MEKSLLSREYGKESALESRLFSSRDLQSCDFWPSQQLVLFKTQGSRFRFRAVCAPSKVTVPKMLR